MMQHNTSTSHRISHAPKVTIISGGQTGVDRAALDVALDNSFQASGYCPKGRLAEDGAIPDKYSLTETKSREYPERTTLNVKESDGTLIIHGGEIGRGTKLTISTAKKFGRPCLIVDVNTPASPVEFVQWLNDNKIEKLNVAGTRAKSCSGIYDKAYDLLSSYLAATTKECLPKE